MPDKYQVSATCILGAKVLCIKQKNPFVAGDNLFVAGHHKWQREGMDEFTKWFIHMNETPACEQTLLLDSTRIDIKQTLVQISDLPFINPNIRQHNCFSTSPS